MGLQKTGSGLDASALLPSSLFHCARRLGGQHLVPQGFSGEVTGMPVSWLKGELSEEFQGRYLGFFGAGPGRDVASHAASVSLREGYVRHGFLGNYLGSGLQVNSPRRSDPYCVTEVLGDPWT